MDLLEWLDNKNQMPNSVKQKKVSAVVLVASVCILMLVSAIIYVTKSRIIYFWDDATYWDMSRDVVSGKIDGALWHNVYNSIGTNDYNYVAAMPSAVWMKLFGTTRLSYVIGLIVMYIMPSMIIMYRLAAKLSKSPQFAFVAAVFSVPAATYMACLGFVDVGGYLIALIAYNLYFTADKKNNSVFRFIVIGCLLTLIMIFRRYFAFFSISFFTAMTIDSILFKRNWSQLISAAAAALVVLCIGFTPFLTGILLKDYGTLYAGYKFPVMTDIRFLTRYFGAVFIIILFMVPFISIIRRKDFRPIFCWIQLIVCGAMFMSVQSHGQQHLFLYMPSLVVLVMFGVNCITKEKILVGVSILVAIQSLSPFINRTQPKTMLEINHLSLAPSYSVKALKDKNVDEILQIKRKLDLFIPEGESCHVLASSFTLNDSILRNVEPSINVKSSRDSEYITALPEVDSRDLSRLNEIYDANYILVAIPAQTHLAEGQQKIVQEAVASFITDSDIAQIFDPVKGFDEYVGDIEVKLYKRSGTLDAIRKKAFESRVHQDI